MLALHKLGMLRPWAKAPFLHSKVAPSQRTVLSNYFCNSFVTNKALKMVLKFNPGLNIVGILIQINETFS